MRCWFYSSYHFCYTKAWKWVEADTSFQKYLRVWHKFICVLFRIWRYGLYHTGTDGRPILPITMIIPSRLHSKMQIAWREAEFLQSNSIICPEASDTDPADKLNKAMIDMFITILIESFPTVYPSNHSPLIYFACLMGLDFKTGQYRTARQHTPYLAPLLWIIRLIVLIHLNPIDTLNHKFQTEHWEQSAGSGSLFPTRGHDYTQQLTTNSIVDQLIAFRNEYLRTDRNYPFNELISAFIYARVIGSNENAPSTCEWNMELDTVIILK